MKKILSFVLVLAIFLTMIPAVAAANEKETNSIELQASTQPVLLSVSSAAGAENTDVAVSVNISENSNLAAADILLVYDNTKLICKSAVEGVAASGGTSSSSINSSFSVVGNLTTIKQTFVDGDSITVGGSMMEITFSVLPGWSGASTLLTLTVEDFYDANYQLLTHEIGNGSVTNTTSISSTITFNSNGGSAVANLTGNVGDNVNIPANPFKTGYTFTGWNPALPKTFPLGGFAVTAKWAELNPVSLSASNATGAENTDVVISVNITANSYLAAADIYLVYDNTKLICKGAVEGVAASGGTSSSSINSSFSVAGNLTTIKQLFVDGDGITGSGSMMEITFTVLPGWSGASTPLTLTVEDFYDANYQLLSLEIGNSSVTNTTPISSTITFNSAGGTTVADLNGNVGDAVTVPANPVRTGYTFTGWNPALPATFPLGGFATTAKWAALNPVSLQVSSAAGMENTDVVISINISANSYLAAADIFLVYDNTKLICKSATAGSVVLESNSISSINSSFSEVDNLTTIKQLIVNESGIIEGGAVIDITFTIMPGWSGGITPLTLAIGDFYDSSLPYPISLTPSLLNGSVANKTSVSSTITFNSAGGSTVANLTGNVGDAVTVPANPIKTGYTFTGWNPALPATFPLDGLSVTAQWKVNTYHAIFMVDGAVYVNVPTEFGAQIVRPANPVKSGYTFLYWTPPVSTMGAADKTFIAIFSVIRYTITFDANGGTLYPVNPVQIVYYGQLPTIPQVTKTGHSFLGWSPQIGTATADVTYTALWAAISYKISFDAAGGTGGSSQTVAYGATPTAPVVNKTGYSFDGWSPAVSAVTGDALYIAQWKINTYNANFMVDGAMYVTVPTEFGAQIIAPAKPIKTGYTFVRWTPSVSTMGAADTTFNAVFTIITYTICWDANGGTGSICQTLNYFETPSPPTVTRTGYTFAGWSPDIIPGPHDATYTAQWHINNYTIFFDANGGTGGETLPLDYGTLPTPPTVTRTGYTFMGWTPLIETVTKNTTYLAEWQINRYTITFNANGGIGGEVQTVDYGTMPTTPVVTKDGYIFSGWSSAISAVTGNATYTAKWIMLGDIDNTGTITIIDALMTLQQVSGFNLLSDIQIIVADVDRNSSISIIDALKILQYVSGIIKVF